MNSTPILDTKAQKLHSSLNQMTNSYKAYWLLALIDENLHSNGKPCTIYKLCCRMIVKAWYTVHYFRLNFGALDKLQEHSLAIREILGLNASIDENKLLDILIHTENKRVQKLIFVFYKNVPFRFLSSWIRYTTDNQVAMHSQNPTLEVPYALFKEEGNLISSKILIHTRWQLFFKENYTLIYDYALFRLATFFQRRNQGVPNIINKLYRPLERESLTPQHKFWDLVLEKEEIRCIYTEELINKKKYTAEHFIPWSFVAHNQIWNIVPAPQSINSSKSNKLPQDLFIPRFVKTQHLGLKSVYSSNKNHDLFADLSTLGASVGELLEMNYTSFEQIYTSQIKHHCMIAKQLGFVEWAFSPQNIG